MRPPAGDFGGPSKEFRARAKRSLPPRRTTRAVLFLPEQLAPLAKPVCAVGHAGPARTESPMSARIWRISVRAQRLRAKLIARGAAPVQRGVCVVDHFARLHRVPPSRGLADTPVTAPESQPPAITSPTRLWPRRRSRCGVVRRLRWFELKSAALRLSAWPESSRLPTRASTARQDRRHT